MREFFVLGVVVLVLPHAVLAVVACPTENQVDLDGDGKADALFTITSDQFRLKNLDGTTVWVVELTEDQKNLKCVEVSDVTSDGIVDFIVVYETPQYISYVLISGTDGLSKVLVVEKPETWFDALIEGGVRIIYSNDGRETTTELVLPHDSLSVNSSTQPLGGADTSMGVSGYYLALTLLTGLMLVAKKRRRY